MSKRVLTQEQLEARREYNRRYRRQAYVRVRNDASNAEYNSEIRKIKEASPCTDCGFKYPYYVMDFDHIPDRGEKLKVMSRRTSLAIQLAEIDKCELVCSNCHRKRTFERGQYHRPRLEDVERFTTQSPGWKQSQKTHCPSGHPYDEENTQISYTNGQRRRACKICNKISKAKYLKKLSEKNMQVSSPL